MKGKRTESGASKMVSNNKATAQVPERLKFFFRLHCVVDVCFALPLMLRPDVLLHLFGFQIVDVYSARLLAAALFAIGLSSWGVERHVDVWRAMLTLKCLFSGFALLGLALSILESPVAIPWGAWLVSAMFVAFHFLWQYYRITL